MRIQRITFFIKTVNGDTMWAGVFLVVVSTMDITILTHCLGQRVNLNAGLF
jgi:hypothetical protein